MIKTRIQTKYIYRQQKSGQILNTTTALKFMKTQFIKSKTPSHFNTSEHGFSLTELIVATAITGILGSIALPNFIDTMHGSRPKETITTLATIHATVGAFIDATGELPTKWDELSSIAAVMTENGQATGNLTEEITLPGSIYKLKLISLDENLYTFDAIRIDNIKNYDIKSCFNASNGASDINSGDGTTNATEPICS